MTRNKTYGEEPASRGYGRFEWFVIREKMKAL